MRRVFAAGAVLALATGATLAFTVDESLTTASAQTSSASTGGPGRMLTATPIDDLDPALAAASKRADRITYRSTSLAGRKIEVSGALFTPNGKPPRGGWPVVSWAHGSSGISDKCAPSSVRNPEGKIDLYGYSGFVSQMLDSRYAVVATDFEGLGTVGDHPYIVADSEGRGVIDAASAAISADRSLSTKVFAVGHSQGGHAAIAAGELARTRGKDLDFRGTVGLAPVTDVGQAYSYGSPGPVDRGFYLLALHGLKTVHPELRFSELLGKQALAMLPSVSQKCTAEIWTEFTANLGDQLNDFQFTPQNPVAALKLQGWLDDQTVPRGKSAGPMLLVQGDQDPSIKEAVTRQAVRNVKAAGSAAEFTSYPGMDHYQVLGPRSSGGAGDDVIAWMDEHQDD